MSYYISSIKDNDALKGFDRYLFLLGDYHLDTPMNKYFKSEFINLGRKFARKGVIVSNYIEQNQQFLFELSGVLKQNMGLNHDKINNITDLQNLKKPALMITEENPNNLSKDSFLLIIEFSDLSKIYPDIEDLNVDILNYVIDDNRKFIEKIQRYQCPLNQIIEKATGFINSPVGGVACACLGIVL